jgi:hypothetical protein
MYGTLQGNIRDRLTPQHHSAAKEMVLIQISRIAFLKLCPNSLLRIGQNVRSNADNILSTIFNRSLQWRQRA